MGGTGPAIEGGGARPAARSSVTEHGRYSGDDTLEDLLGTPGGDEDEGGQGQEQSDEYSQGSFEQTGAPAAPAPPPNPAQQGTPDGLSWFGPHQV